MTSFTDAAEHILFHSKEQPDEAYWRALTAWLNEAPAHVFDNTFLWTKMVRVALLKSEEMVVEDSAWVVALGPYLDHLASLSGEALSALSVQTEFESAMRHLAFTIGEEQHSSLAALFDTGWRPVALMKSIDAHADAVSASLREHKGYCVPLADTGGGNFLVAMYPLFWSSRWEIEPDPIYAKLFETYFLSNEGPNVECDCTFIRNVLSAAPGELYKALWFLRRQMNTTEAHLEAIFPLPLSDDNADENIAELMFLMTQEQPLITGKTMPLLEHYHPELAQLLSLHLSLFPDAGPEKSYADVLVESYRLLRHHQGALQDMDSSVFEVCEPGA